MNELTTTGTATPHQRAADQCLADVAVPRLPAPLPQRWPRPFLAALGVTVAVMLGALTTVILAVRLDTLAHFSLMSTGLVPQDLSQRSDDTAEGADAARDNAAAAGAAEPGACSQEQRPRRSAARTAITDAA